MSSATTTSGQDSYPQTGQQTGEFGSAASRALRRVDPSRQPDAGGGTGLAIRSFEPSPLAWVAETALESPMHGLPYVPDSRVAVALPAVRRAIAETREALRRVSEQQALALIGVIGMSRKSGRMTDIDAQARVAAMLDEWRDIPADILRDAVDEYRRSGDERDDWMPTGGRIRALAMPALNRRMMRLRNLLDLEADLQHRQNRMAALARDPSPETLAAIKAIRGRG